MFIYDSRTFIFPETAIGWEKFHEEKNKWLNEHSKNKKDFRINLVHHTKREVIFYVSWLDPEVLLESVQTSVMPISPLAPSVHSHPSIGDGLPAIDFYFSKEGEPLEPILASELNIAPAALRMVRNCVLVLGGFQNIKGSLFDSQKFTADALPRAQQLFLGAPLNEVQAMLGTIRSLCETHKKACGAYCNASLNLQLFLDIFETAQKTFQGALS